MQRLKFDVPGDATSFTPGRRQLALDEAMLVWADDQVARENETDTESIRFWAFRRPTVVLGRSSKVDLEVDVAGCDQDGVDITRRCTGGASVVGGPGCRMYSVVLRLRADQSIRNIDAAHDHVIARVLAAVRRQVPNAARQGICDLTIGDRKFSGNSLRITKHHVLYHGTILHDADLDAFARRLRFAPRQPDYRRGREHRHFIGNAGIDIDRFQDDLSNEFAADDDHASRRESIASRRESIESVADSLLSQRYDDNAWHRRI